jgi:hypothetical protein
MKSLRLAKLKAAIASLYVAAMLAFGFAHAPLGPPLQVDAAEAMAWLAAGLHDNVAVCGGDGGAHQVHHGGDCAACRLTAAPGLPPSPGLALRAPSCASSLAPPVEPPSPFSRRVARAKSRGPPSI